MRILSHTHIHSHTQASLEDGSKLEMSYGNISLNDKMINVNSAIGVCRFINTGWYIRVLCTSIIGWTWWLHAPAMCDGA